MNLVANHTHRLKIFSVLILSVLSFQASAKTLRELAQTSNVLLVLSDRVDDQGKGEIKKRSCGLSHAQISERSQRLQAQIDQKIENLTARDLTLITLRLKSCEKDCTCDIYALALDKRRETETKVPELTPDQRKKCASKLKNICQRAKL